MWAWPGIRVRPLAGAQSAGGTDLRMLANSMDFHFISTGPAPGDQVGSGRSLWLQGPLSDSGSALETPAGFTIRVEGWTNY